MPTANSVGLRNTPYTRKDILKANFGFFAQDKWTMNRLTMTSGARYDYFNGYAPEQDNPAGRFVPARHSDELTAFRAGTTGRFAAARHTTSSAPAKRRSRHRSASSSRSKRSG